MRIDHQARLSMHVTEHDVGGLASHSAQGDEILHRVGQPVAEALDDVLRGGLERFGFLTKEPGADDHALDVARIGGRHRGGIGIFREQRGRHLIDALIGALRGQESSPRDIAREF